MIYVSRAPNIDEPWKAILRFGAHAWPCVIGKNGMAARKVEGDLKTPIGVHGFKQLWARKDRRYAHKIPHANSGIWCAKEISSHCAWCDAPSNPNYNRHVQLPFNASHEVLKREDRLYDLLIELDWNYSPRSRNRGSAIFLHLAPLPGQSEVSEMSEQKKIGGTAGCVAMHPRHLGQLLQILHKTSKNRQMKIG